MKFRWTILEFLVGEEVREISECLHECVWKPALFSHVYSTSIHILGAWCGRHSGSVGECLRSLLKPDNGFVDLCHSLADSTLLEFLCEYVSEG